MDEDYGIRETTIYFESIRDVLTRVRHLLSCPGERDDLGTFFDRVGLDITAGMQRLQPFRMDLDTVKALIDSYVQVENLTYHDCQVIEASSQHESLPKTDLTNSAIQFLKHLRL